MEPVRIIGIGADGAEGVPVPVRRWIEQADLLVGGRRHLDYFPEYSGEVLAVQEGLSRAVDRIDQARREGRRVVVLASGDPNFFGIGGYLAKKLGPEQVEIHPHVSSVQLAFARIKEPWQDAFLASVHGRDVEPVVDWVRTHAKVALVTSDGSTPGRIARALQKAGVSEVEVFVGENLGAPDERTGWYTVADAAEQEFAPLNVVVIRRRQDGGGTGAEAHKKGASGEAVWPLGIDDEAFFQRKPKRGLITKQEVRVVSLAKLHIRPGAVMWDIGACTGSVGIEAAGLAEGVRVYAIEKNEEDCENLRRNVEKFHRPVHWVHGTAPDGLEAFPDPDAVFLGGTAGRMEELLDVCVRRLRPGGRIVVNAATLENLYQAVEGLRNRGMAVDVTLIQVARSRPIKDLTRFEAFDPVYIVAARRAEEGAGNENG
ncbi:precorrin-6y C5,15-methyltransferase (decarboxylating) subunit CbiE [Kyrpidia spormannii]|uniref:precorrin-6y C5,15-methyltransferase (decarboxylating) subunit CbiE n=1 Tax=Kyrpidia spormannii TaxID=2055160 RepID=UPI0014765A77|nr:precorrin-6y C5,15-methyltransferase (decarboxylating) subunit CbiE [Kyrpidia spormannii]